MAEVLPGDILGSNIRRKEHGSNTTGLQSGQVGVVFRAGASDVEPFHGHARNVIVRIDEQRGTVDPVHLSFRNFPLRCRQICKRKQRRQSSQRNLVQEPHGAHSFWKDDKLPAVRQSSLGSCVCVDSDYRSAQPAP